MKFNKSSNHTVQPAAAPLQQESQSRALPNRAARRSDAVQNRAASDPAMPFRTQLIEKHIALSAATSTPDRILRLPEVLAMVGIGRTSLLAMVKNQHFPAPLKLSTRIRGWRLSAVEAYLASKEAE